MTALVPCAACRRHVRRHALHCPFCGAERRPASGALRPSTAARDASRATLVAIGLTVASQACGGKGDDADERGNVGVIAPYGLGPIEEPGGSGGGGAGGAEGGGATNDGGSSGSSPLVPPYGAAPFPNPNGDPDGADTPDAGRDDAGGDDAAGGDAGGALPAADAGD